MKKLSLNKEVVASLSSKEMNGVKGLTGQTCVGETCALSGCDCPTYVGESCDYCIASEAYSNCPACII